MTDIVERLCAIMHPAFREVAIEAAEENKRLRAEIEWLRDVVAAAAPAPEPSEMWFSGGRLQGVIYGDKDKPPTEIGWLASGLRHASCA